MELINEVSASELLQAQAHIWHQTFNFVKSMSLKCAVELGIPDIIHRHGQPMALPELVAALKIHSTKGQHLYRLMCILVQTGFFAQQKFGDDHHEEGYVLNNASRLLLKDNPFSARPLVFFVLDPVLTKPWDCMSTWLQNDDPNPFFTAHGKTLWKCAGNEPRLNHLFNDAMASDSSLISEAVILRCKEVFEGLGSLVDVGGGTGTMAKAIARAFPLLKCTVFDLPHVVADFEGNKKVKYLGGDMFESIPPADAILLKWILHDWSDNDCVKVLKQCKEAIKGKGKLIIIDIVVGNHDWDEKETETQLCIDMEMMVATVGRERKEQEWAKLFFDAGFCNYKIYPVLGLRALIEVYP